MARDTCSCTASAIRALTKGSDGTEGDQHHQEPGHQGVLAAAGEPQPRGGHETRW